MAKVAGESRPFVFSPPEIFSSEQPFAICAAGLAIGVLRHPYGMIARRRGSGGTRSAPLPKACAQIRPRHALAGRAPISPIFQPALSFGLSASGRSSLPGGTGPAFMHGFAAAGGCYL